MHPVDHWPALMVSMSLSTPYEQRTTYNHPKRQAAGHQIHLEDRQSQDQRVLDAGDQSQSRPEEVHRHSHTQQ